MAKERKTKDVFWMYTSTDGIKWQLQGDVDSYFIAMVYCNEWKEHNPGGKTKIEKHRVPKHSGWWLPF